MRRVLIVRPQPGADATARRAAAHGLSPILFPLFVVRPIGWQAPDAAGFDGVLMTSANAARHGGPALRSYHGLPLFAVGTATADAARAAGFGEVVVGDGDGAAIVEWAATTGHRRLLHLAGRDYLPLYRAGVAIERRIVYAADAIDAAPPDADVVLLHSPRAAVRFAGLAPHRERVAIAALSAAVAAAAGSGWRAVAIAATPDDDALLAAAARLCDQVGACPGQATGIEHD